MKFTSRYFETKAMEAIEAAEFFNASEDDFRRYTARAQVYATLALAAATREASMRGRVTP